MEQRVYNLLPNKWRAQMKMFTEEEFKNKKDRDGALVKAADDLSAYIEAYLSSKNGIQSEDLELAKYALLEKYKDQVICGVDFGKIYQEFD